MQLGATSATKGEPVSLEQVPSTLRCLAVGAVGRPGRLLAMASVPLLEWSQGLVSIAEKARDMEPGVTAYLGIDLGP